MVQKAVNGRYCFSLQILERVQFYVGKKVKVDGKLEGEAVGITPTGELLLRDDHGKITAVSSGDVVLLKK